MHNAMHDTKFNKNFTEKAMHIILLLLVMCMLILIGH